MDIITAYQIVAIALISTNIVLLMTLSVLVLSNWRLRENFKITHAVLQELMIKAQSQHKDKIQGAFKNNIDNNM